MDESEGRPASAAPHQDHLTAAQRALIDGAPEAEKALLDLGNVGGEIEGRIRDETQANALSPNDLDEIHEKSAATEQKLDENDRLLEADRQNLKDQFDHVQNSGDTPVGPADAEVDRNNLTREMRDARADHDISGIQSVLDGERAKLDVLARAGENPDDVKNFNDRLDAVQAELNSARVLVHQNIAKDTDERNADAYEIDIARQRLSELNDMQELSLKKLDLNSKNIDDVQSHMEKERAAEDDVQAALDRATQLHEEMNVAFRASLDDLMDARLGLIDASRTPGEALDDATASFTDASAHFRSVSDLASASEGRGQPPEDLAAKMISEEDALHAAVLRSEAGPDVIGTAKAFDAEDKDIGATLDRLKAEHPEGVPLNDLRDLDLRAHQLAERAREAHDEILPVLDSAIRSVPAPGHDDHPLRQDELTDPIPTARVFSTPGPEAAPLPSDQAGYSVALATEETYRGARTVVEVHRVDDVQIVQATAGHDPAPSDPPSVSAHDDPGATGHVEGVGAAVQTADPQGHAYDAVSETST